MIVLHDRMQDTCITYTCTAVHHECQMFPGTTRHGLLYKAMSMMWDCGCQLAWEQGYCVNNPCIPYHYSHGTHKDHCYHYSWVVNCINWSKHVSASGLCSHFIFSFPTRIKHCNAVVSVQAHRNLKTIFRTNLQCDSNSDTESSFQCNCWWPHRQYVVCCGHSFSNVKTTLWC